MLAVALIAGISQGSINLVRGNSHKDLFRASFTHQPIRTRVPRVLRGTLSLSRGAFSCVEDSETCVVEKRYRVPSESKMETRTVSLAFRVNH